MQRNKKNRKGTKIIAIRLLITEGNNKDKGSSNKNNDNSNNND